MNYLEWINAGNSPYAREAERQRLNALTQARWRAEESARAAAEAAAAEARVPAEYLAQFPPMRRARVLAALMAVIRLDGAPLQRWEAAHRFAAEGVRVDANLGRIYHGAAGCFYALDGAISRTAADFALWLQDRAGGAKAP